MTAAPSVPHRRVTAPAGTAALLIALAGLAVSLYLTVEHFTASKQLACPENSVINCAKVTSSSYAKIGPVPVALLGALYFLAMAVLSLPRAWQLRQLDTVRIGASVVGVGSVLWFLWVELFRIDAICLWCTVVHAATLALLAAVLWTTSGLRAHS